jgi:ribonuclease HIII
LDSKRISNSRVKSIASRLIHSLKHSIVKISPQKYNQLYKKFKNINQILGWAHAQAIKNLLEKKVQPLIILIDKFGPDHRVLSHFGDNTIRNKIQLFNQAEKDLAVGAASIIARQTFLQELEKLSLTAGTPLPLGAGEPVIQAGIKIARTKGIETMEQIAKIHFKTYTTIREKALAE